MPEKKLTDNEIKKALDICSKTTNGCSHSKYTCEDCYLNGQPMCSSVLIQDAIDYFNRLQADNNELLGKIKQLEANRLKLLENIEWLESVITQIKAAAYKEFAERLKERADEFKQVRLDGKWAVSQYDIDKLLKEKIGENNG